MNDDLTRLLLAIQFIPHVCRDQDQVNFLYNFIIF